MKNIVIKKPFLDKEEGGKRRKFGDKLLVSLQRAKHLIELGLAVAATIEEGKEILSSEPPPTEAVFKPGQQWAETPEVNNKKKARKK